MLSGNWCILASVLLKSSRGDGCSLCSSTGPFHAYSFAYPCPSSGPPEVRCFGARLSSPPFFESPVLWILRCAQQPQCQERLPETWAPVPNCLERFFTSKAKRIVPFPELPLAHLPSVCLDTCAHTGSCAGMSLPPFFPWPFRNLGSGPTDGPSHSSLLFLPPSSSPPQSFSVGSISLGRHSLRGKKVISDSKERNN